jgi:hypothetical protein
MPKSFGRLLTAHEILHTSQLGWGKLENGMLLSAAAQQNFTALITVDSNMSSQQNLGGRSISLVVLRAKTNSVVSLEPLVPQILEALKHLSPGKVIYIGNKNSDL